MFLSLNNMSLPDPLDQGEPLSSPHSSLFPSSSFPLHQPRILREGKEEEEQEKDKEEQTKKEEKKQKDSKADLPGALGVGALGDDDDLVDGHNDGRPHEEAAHEIRESHSWDTSLR